MIVLHWLQAPIRGADALGLVVIWAAIHLSFTESLVRSSWHRAKTKLDLELQQLRQRRNLAELAAQQAEERARGR